MRKGRYEELTVKDSSNFNKGNIDYEGILKGKRTRLFLLL